MALASALDPVVGEEGRPGLTISRVVAVAVKEWWGLVVGKGEDDMRKKRKGTKEKRRCWDERPLKGILGVDHDTVA